MAETFCIENISIKNSYFWPDMRAFLRKYYLLPILLLLGIWSGRFIYQTSFEYEGVRGFSLFDDAMISMAYAKNFTQGYGLNWAKFGEPVEGYSNPLWTFLMIPFQYLPVGWEKVSLYFAIFCFGILCLNVIAFDRLLRKAFAVDSPILLFLSALTLSFLYPLNYWTLEGMETGLQSLLFLGGLYYLHAFWNEGNTKALRNLGIVLALALLLRMDMVFFVGITILPLLPWIWKNKPAGIKFLLITGLPMLAYLIFRLFYFKDIFPNTYYLKLADFPLDLRLARGWFYFKQFASQLWLIFSLLPLTMIVLRKHKIAWLAFGLILTYFGYSIYVGADAWEGSRVGANRFLSPVLPLIIILLSAGFYTFASKLSANLRLTVGILLPFLANALFFINVNGLLFANDNNWKLKQLLIQTKPEGTDYHMWNAWRAFDMNKILGKKNRVAVTQAGGLGYFGHFELVDILGYNDKVIGHGPTYYDMYSVKPEMNLPGHQKLNYRRSLDELKPDYIENLWSKNSPAIEAQFDSLIIELHFVRQSYGGWLREGFVKKD